MWVACVYRPGSHAHLIARRNLLAGFGEEEEEEEEGPLADPTRTDIPDNIKKKIEKEMDRQGRFQRKLKLLREELEHAHFAKPVCAKYLHPY